MSLRKDGPPGEPAGPPRVTPEIAAEAAMWVARLHGPSRSREMELLCLEWQARSAAHRHAFERCTETWMEVPNAARAGGFATSGGDDAAPEEKGGGGGRTRRGRPFMLAAVAVVGIVAGAVTLRPWDGSAEYRTAVGEAQSVVLDDGSRMSLNTDTRARVEFSSKQRTVDLDGGEAAFEVAKDARRPFVVRAAGSEVVALGTVFSVRLNPRDSNARESLSVTLVEGQVSVRPSAGVREAALRPLVMRPGERVRLVKDLGGRAEATPQVDRPRLEQVLAWQRNEAVFDKASLAEAVAEMNRYSRTPVVLTGDLAQADWQVSGQFRTGDNAAFANALAMLHGLVVHQSGGRLELSRAR
jgi:transmembrane sensor